MRVEGISHVATHRQGPFDMAERHRKVPGVIAREGHDVQRIEVAGLNLEDRLRLPDGLCKIAFLKRGKRLPELVQGAGHCCS